MMLIIKGRLKELSFESQRFKVNGFYWDRDYGEKIWGFFGLDVQKAIEYVEFQIVRGCGAGVGSAALAPRSTAGQAVIT